MSNQTYEHNFTSNNEKMSTEEKPASKDHWEEFIIQSDFLYLYFNDVGINPNLSIEKFTEFKDIIKRNDRSFHFAIVRTRNKIFKDDDDDEDEDEYGHINQKSENPTNEVLDKRIFICYPEYDYNIATSGHFLFLCYSGFINSYLNNDKSSLFLNVSKKTAKFSQLMYNMYRKFNNEKDSISNNYYKEVERMEALRFEHANLVEKYFRENLKILLKQMDENIIVNENEKFSYSLFFIRKERFYEYRGCDNTLILLSVSVNESNVIAYLLEKISKTNERKDEDNFEFLKDITIFEEIKIGNSENNNIKKESTDTISIIISIIVIITFIFLNPSDIFFIQKSSLVGYFEQDLYSNSILYKITNKKKLNDYFNFILDKIYMKNNLPIYHGQLIQITKLINDTETVTTKNITIDESRSYLLGTNYFCGMMVNFKQTGYYPSKTFNNNDTINIRNSEWSYQDSLPVDMVYDDFDAGFLNRNPYIDNSRYLYFKPNINKYQLNWYKDMVRDIVFNDKLYDLSLDVIVYNFNTEVSMLYSIDFYLNSLDEFEIVSTAQGYLPFINYSTSFIFLLIINIIFFLGLTYTAFITFRSFINSILDSISRRQIFIEIFDIFEIIFIILSFTSQFIASFYFILRSSHFSIAIYNEDDFFIRLGEFVNMGLYSKLTGILMFIITIKLIRVIYNNFPEMGIVYQTISIAYKELLALMSIIGIGLLIISVVAHIILGYYNLSFVYITQSILQIILMFIGIYDDEIYSKQIGNFNPISIPFSIVFLVFFFLVSNQVFLTIIRTNYSELRNTSDISNKIFTKILQDQSDQIKKQFASLFVCKDPILCEAEDKNNNLNNLNTEIDNVSVENKKITIKDEDESNVNKPKFNTSAWLTFKYHLNKLFYTFRNADNYIKDNLKKKKYQKHKEILETNLRFEMKELEVNYEFEFDLLIGSFYHFIYLMIFFIMVFGQLQISDSRLVATYAKSVIEQQVGDVRNVMNWDEVKKNLDKFVADTYKYDIEKPNCSNETNFRQNSIEFYRFLNHPFYRITVRKIRYELNTHEYEKNYFIYNKNDPTPLTDTFCNSISEDTRILFHKVLNGTTVELSQFNWISGSSLLTPNNCGGYVYLLNKTCPYCQKVNQNYTNFSDKLIDELLDSLILDAVLFPITHDQMVYVKVSYNRDLSSKIKYSSIYYTIPINRYQSTKDFYRMITEIIFWCLFLFLLIHKFKNIWIKLKNILEKDYKQSKDHDLYTRSSMFGKYIRFNFSKHEKDSFINFIFYFVGLIVYKAINFVFYLILAYIEFLKENLIFNLSDSIGVVVTISFGAIWYRITTLTTQLNLKLIDNVDENSVSTYNIQIASQLYHLYTSYISLVSANMLIMFFRFIQYFRFSKSIGLQFLAIEKSINTIIFHLIFVAICNIGFVLMSFAIFSNNIYWFSNFSINILSTLVAISGNIRTDWFHNQEFNYIFLYLLLVSVFNSLILFNLLASIVVESYRSLKQQQEVNSSSNKQINVLEYVYRIINKMWEIFAARCDLYYYNFKNLVEQCNEIDTNYNNAIKEIKNEYIINEESRSKYLKNYIHTTEVKIYEILENMNSCTDKTIKADCYFGNLFPEKENGIDISDKKKEEYKQKKKEIVNEFKIINPTDFISIWTKIFVYIAYIIGGNHIFSNKSIDQTNTYKTKNPEVPKKQTGHKQIFRDNNANNGENKLYGKYINELKTNFTGISLFKSNLLDKYKNHVYYSLNNYKNYGIKSYNQFLDISNLNLEKFYNLSCNLPCPIYPQCQNTSSCKQICKCDDIKNYFRSISVLIYDLLIKYFHIPKQKFAEEQLLLNNYYIEIFKQFKPDPNKPDPNKPDFISTNKIKIKLFENDISYLIKYIRELDAINIYEFIQYRYNQKSLNNHERLDYIQSLFKFFTIWNTLFIILLERDSKFVNELKDLSFTRKIFNDFSQKREESIIKEECFTEKYKNYYQAILYILYDYDEENNVFKSQSFGNNNKLRLGADGMKESELISEINLFLDQYKYHFEENTLLQLSEIIPREEESKTSSIPQILIKLWKTLHQTDKFVVFFGYNKYVMEQSELSNFLKNDFLNDQQINFQINTMFTQLHRSEFLKMIKFPKKIEIDLISKLKKYHEDKTGDILVDVNNFTMSDVLKYFYLERINFVNYFDFITQNLLNNHFRAIKRIVNKIHEEFTKTFNAMINLNRDHYQNNEYSTNLEIVKFCNMYMSKVKFETIITYYESISKGFKLGGVDFEEDEEYLNDSEFEVANQNKVIDKDSQPILTSSDNKINVNEKQENVDQNKLKDKNSQPKLMSIDKMININEKQENVDQNKIIDKNSQPKLTSSDKKININENSVIDSFKTYEIIIFIASMSPFQLIDVIKCLTDVEMRDLYMFIFIYLYYDDPDYNQFESYLKKNLENDISLKCVNYSEYLEKRFIMLNLKNKYEIEKYQSEKTLDYMKHLKNSIEKFTHIKKSIIEKMKLKISNFESKNYQTLFDISKLENN